MRLVIIGYGYSGRAIAGELADAASLTVSVRDGLRAEKLRQEGVNALAFDGTFLPPALGKALDDATHLLVCAPPDEAGDPLIKVGEDALMDAPNLRHVAYLSTVGVYGDHGGDWVREGSALKPTSLRSRQREIAEKCWMILASNKGLDLGLFRLSGIYGPGRSAIDNLRAGTARRIIKPGQVFNRIHVADIAGAVAQALRRPHLLDTYNLTDDEPAPPQDVVAHAADLMGVPVPPDIPFEEAPLSPMGRSFYGENKRVSNAHLKAQLGYVLRYPSYREGLRAILDHGTPLQGP